MTKKNPKAKSFLFCSRQKKYKMTIRIWMLQKNIKLLVKNFVLAVTRSFDCVVQQRIIKFILINVSIVFFWENDLTRQNNKLTNLFQRKWTNKKKRGEKRYKMTCQVRGARDLHGSTNATKILWNCNSCGLNHLSCRLSPISAQISVFVSCF